MQNVLVGFFKVDGVLDSVETPLVGNPKAEYQSLTQLVRAKHPDASSIVRSGSRIESRNEEEPGYIFLAPGRTLRQIFDDADGKSESVRKVGKVFFTSQPCEVFLLFSRAAGVVTLFLKPSIGSAAPIKFSNRMSPQSPVTELPGTLKNILGADARDLDLLFREAL